MKISLILILFTFFATAAFGDSFVKHVLPADATNIHVTAADLEPYQTGEKLVSDVGSDGPVYEGVYSTKLFVEVVYDSKDDTDAPKTGSGPDGQFEGDDSTQPVLNFYLDVTDAQIAAINSGKTHAIDLVSTHVATVAVTMDDPNYENQCSYDMDSGAKLDDSCVEKITTITVMLPELTIGMSGR